MWHQVTDLEIKLFNCGGNKKNKSTVMKMTTEHKSYDN